MWTWLGGSKQTNAISNYEATISYFPHYNETESNWEGARCNSAFFYARQTKALYLYGGLGSAPVSPNFSTGDIPRGIKTGQGHDLMMTGTLRDLVRFNHTSKSWLFVQGVNIFAFEASSYGTKMVRTFDKSPGGRRGAAVFYVNRTNSVYLFGGAVNEDKVTVGAQGGNTVPREDRSQPDLHG